MNSKATDSTVKTQRPIIKANIFIEIFTSSRKPFKNNLFSTFLNLCLKYARYFIEMCLPNEKVNFVCLGAWLLDPAL